MDKVMDKMVDIGENTNTDQIDQIDIENTLIHSHPIQPSFRVCSV